MTGHSAASPYAQRKLKDIGGPAIARIKGSATTQTSQNVILALCLILGFASDTSLSWQEMRVVLPDRVWDDMAVYPQGGWSKSGGARYETGLKAAWGLVKEMSLSDSFVDDQVKHLMERDISRIAACRISHFAACFPFTQAQLFLSDAHTFRGQSRELRVMWILPWPRGAM